jgi:hypothetical protein
LKEESHQASGQEQNRTDENGGYIAMNVAEMRQQQTNALNRDEKNPTL